MKTVASAILAGFACVAVFTCPAAQAARHRFPPPNTNYRAPRPPANSGTNAPTVVEKMFKDLPVNAEFYFATDTEKHFLKVKVSDTTAHTVAKAGRTPESARTIPAESLVIPENPPKQTAQKPAKKN